MFLDRWSPRSFSAEKISEETMLTLIEAARWAPSCYNEQPWLFYYASEAQKHAAFCETLVEQNKMFCLLIGTILLVLFYSVPMLCDSGLRSFGASIACSASGNRDASPLCPIATAARISCVFGDTFKSA